MSKRILVKESAFNKFLQSFFSAKAKGKEDDWMDKLNKIDPRVGQAWDSLDKSIDSGIVKQYRILKSKGIDTSHLDAIVKKYNITV